LTSLGVRIRTDRRLQLLLDTAMVTLEYIHTYLEQRNVS